MLDQFFQITPIPANQMLGAYDARLVCLSYIVAVIASYIALDVTGRIRDVGNSKLTTTLWLLGGSFAMGAGIWSMHFIGMLAFSMDMPAIYDTSWTIISMLVAVTASAFAFFLLKSHNMPLFQMILGGILLGLGIAAMHYTGMIAMTISMNIHYLPGLFSLSIVIAIVASEAALYLAIKSNKGLLKTRIRLKIISALIMGLAICGMHYTGMAAAIFTPIQDLNLDFANDINPNVLAIYIAVVTFFIMGIAFAISTHKEIMNYHIMQLAHEEGMKEVATNVLHNVGNILNSVNVKTTMITNRINHSELAGLTDISISFEKHKEDLFLFLTTDPQGLQLPNYIKMLADYWQQEQQSMIEEMKKLSSHIQHIKDIISTQQSLSKVKNRDEIVSIEDEIEEALQIIDIDQKKTDIVIEKKYQKIKPIFINKIKLLQIIINLIRNAKQALVESSNPSKILMIKCTINKDTLSLQVIDNGVGIKPENLSKIFIHGFTTKQTGHGFGLHASAIAAKELRGDLKVYSAGHEKGAIFTLELPYKTT